MSLAEGAAAGVDPFPSCSGVSSFGVFAGSVEFPEVVLGASFADALAVSAGGAGDLKFAAGGSVSSTVLALSLVGVLV